MNIIIQEKEIYKKKIDSILKGKIPKHLIQDTLGIKNDNSFSKNVLNSQEMKNYIKDKGITVERTNLIFPFD